jgi:hypothetical protein
VLHGKDGARLAAESHSKAINWIERVVREERIGCDFARLNGYLFNPADGDASYIDRESEAARRAGLYPERLLRAPLPFPTGACLRFPEQGQFHILKYLGGLINAIQRHGGSLFSDILATLRIALASMRRRNRRNQALALIEPRLGLSTSCEVLGISDSVRPRTHHDLRTPDCIWTPTPCRARSALYRNIAPSYTYRLSGMEGEDRSAY